MEQGVYEGCFLCPLYPLLCEYCWTRLRDSHAIHASFVTCCKTSLPWAGKTRNMYRFCCKITEQNYSLISPTTFCNLQRPSTRFTVACRTGVNFRRAKTSAKRARSAFPRRAFLMSRTPRSLLACFSSPEKREEITPLLQASFAAMIQNKLPVFVAPLSKSDHHQLSPNNIIGQLRERL